MTGAEHYAEAERLLLLAHDMADQGNRERADFVIARAQVHATLALAAATAHPAHPYGSWESAYGQKRACEARS